MTRPSAKRKALTALILLVSAANLGIATRLYLPNIVGQIIFVVTRLWILGLPLLWLFGVERQRLRLAWPTHKMLLHGFGLGIAMLLGILVAYWQVGRHWMDIDIIRSTTVVLGLNHPSIFLGFAIYFTFINAFVEEYIWRWFVYRQCEILVTNIWAILLASVCFMLHHIIALQGYVGNLWITVLGSLGVFIAGLIWSVCYLKYRSLWVGYISHMMADLAIAIVSGHILFGNF